MKFYKTNDTLVTVEEVEVERVTEKSVWINGERNSRLSGYNRFYPTLEEAKQSIINVAKADYEEAQERADYYYEKMIKIEKKLIG